MLVRSEVWQKEMEKDLKIRVRRDCGTEGLEFIGKWSLS